MASTSEPKLSISWHDSSWIPVLNKDNVMDYFSQKSNPFYDRTCNNEIIKMQRADPAQLVNMTGIEYSLYLTQDPILYVIRKVHRQSPDKVIPMADYYILGGVVYQCPDLQSVINSRLLSTLHLVHQAFDEALSYARYEPSRGYYWKFPGDEGEEKKTDNMSKLKDEPTETQRKRVDGLLMELVKHFPPKVIQPKEGTKPIGVGGASVRGDIKDASVAKQPGIPPTSTSTTDIKLPEPKRKKPTQI